MPRRKVSAPAQAVRPEVSQLTFEKVIPPIQGTKLSSAVFVKKALTVAISNIVYLRGILEDEAFDNRSLSSVDLKILDDSETACVRAKQLGKWLRGAFDALDKGFMRGLTLCVHIDPNNLDKTIECYTFKFGYSSDGDCHLCDDNGVILTLDGSKEKLKEETLEMLSKSVRYTKLLNPLPPHVFVSLKLIYSDSTPKDYEPPGYGPASPVTDIGKNHTSVMAGVLETGFHGMKMRIRSTLNIGDKTLAARTSPKTSSTKAQLVQPNSKPSHVVYRFGREVEDEKDDDITVDKVEIVFDCPCGLVVDDGAGLQCSVCYIWQHAICFGIVAHVNMPDDHVCQNCFDRSVGRRCSDVMMENMAECDIAERCQWRRSVLKLLNFDTVNPVDFAQELKVKVSVAQSLLNKMREEEMVSDTMKNGFSRRVNRRRVKEELNAIILPSVLVQEDVIEVEPLNILKEVANNDPEEQVQCLPTNFEENKADGKKSGTRKTYGMSTRKRKKVIKLTQEEENDTKRNCRSDDNRKKPKKVKKIKKF